MSCALNGWFTKRIARGFARSSPALVPVSHCQLFVYCTLLDLIDFPNKSANSYKYMFVAIDNFSRYLFTRPLRNKTPNLTAKAMKESIQEIKEKFDRKIGHI